MKWLLKNRQPILGRDMKEREEVGRKKGLFNLLAAACHA